MFLKDIFIDELKKFFEPPRYLYKFFFLNLFGLQIFRYLFFNFILRINSLFFKKKKLNEKMYLAYRELNNNGIAIVNDFFDVETLDQIYIMIENLEEKNLFNKDFLGNKKVIHGKLDKKFIVKNKNEKSSLEDIIKKTGLIDLISNVLSKSIDELPEITYQKIYSNNDFKDENDINSEFHPDRFYNCIKVFFYLNENKFENGSYEYIKKSHVGNLKRIIFEYFFSIFSSVKCSDRLLNKFGFQFVNKRVTLTKKSIEKNFNNSLIKCNGFKNTLIISNNKGLHRRGKFLPNQTRIQIRMNFYEFQIPFYKRYLKKIAVKNFYK
jgi:hypothetical protein